MANFFVPLTDVLSTFIISMAGALSYAPDKKDKSVALAHANQAKDYENRKAAKALRTTEKYEKCCLG